MLTLLTEMVTDRRRRKPQAPSEAEPGDEKTQVNRVTWGSVLCAVRD